MSNHVDVDSIATQIKAVIDRRVEDELASEAEWHHRYDQLVEHLRFLRKDAQENYDYTKASGLTLSLLELEGMVRAYGNVCKYLDLTAPEGAYASDEDVCAAPPVWARCDQWTPIRDNHALREWLLGSNVPMVPHAIVQPFYGHSDCMSILMPDGRTALIIAGIPTGCLDDYLTKGLMPLGEQADIIREGLKAIRGNSINDSIELSGGMGDYSFYVSWSAIRLYTVAVIMPNITPITAAPDDNGPFDDKVGLHEWLAKLDANGRTFGESKPFGKAGWYMETPPRVMANGQPQTILLLDNIPHANAVTTISEGFAELGRFAKVPIMQPIHDLIAEVNTGKHPKGVTGIAFGYVIYVRRYSQTYCIAIADNIQL